MRLSCLSATMQTALIALFFPLIGVVLKIGPAASLRSKRFRGVGEQGPGFSVFCPREKWGDSQKGKRRRRSRRQTSGYSLTNTARDWLG